MATLARRVTISPSGISGKRRFDNYRSALLRSLCAIYLALVATLSVWVAVPRSFTSTPALVLCASILPVAVLLGAGLFDTLPPRLFVVMQLLSAPLVGGLIYVSGNPDSLLAVLFLWGPPYAFAISGRRFGVVQSIMVGVCYGAVLWLVIRGHPRFEADWRRYVGVWMVMVSTVLTTGLITDRLTSSVRRATERFHRGFTRAVVGTAIVAHDGTLREANDALCMLLARSRERIVGFRLTSFVVHDDLDLVDTEIKDHDAGWEPPRLEVRLQRPSGEVILVEMDAAVIHTGRRDRFLYCQFRDITEARRAHALLERQAMTDSLTQLPNRVMLGERIADALRRRVGQRTTLAVVLLDLDRFKLINDSFGHRAGDAVLVAIGARLRATAGAEGHTVARLGGDEFVVVCEGVTDVDAVLHLAERILSAVRETTRLRDLELTVSTSIGIALAPSRPNRDSAYESSMDPEDLIRHADVAMYQAKSRGGNTIAVFDHAVRDESMARLRTEIALRHAVNAGELEVHYQPVVDLATHEWTGLEALVRWQHPDRGLLSPGEFIAIAEESDLIADVGRFVLYRACTEFSRLRAHVSAAHALRLALNVSVRQLARPGFASELAAVAAELGLPAASLAVEITESLLMGDHDTPGGNTVAVGELEVLRRIGVTVLVDDFGTGFSSLSYLRRLPVDAVKVDRSFVSGVGDDLQDPAIVTAIVDLARALGLQVVAEGVESDGQRVALHRLGCTHGQGFLFERAVPMETIQARLVTAAEARAEHPAGVATRRRHTLAPATGAMAGGRQLARPLGRPGRAGSRWTHLMPRP